MNWNNLKNYKCPKCNVLLKDIGYYHACTRSGCIFSINKEKFDSMVGNMNKPKKFVSEEERTSELNNFDRPIITEDFSDSNFLDL